MLPGLSNTTLRYPEPTTSKSPMLVGICTTVLKVQLPPLCGFTSSKSVPCGSALGLPPQPLLMPQTLPALSATSDALGAPPSISQANALMSDGV